MMKAYAVLGRGYILKLPAIFVALAAVGLCACATTGGSRLPQSASHRDSGVAVNKNRDCEKKPIGDDVFRDLVNVSWCATKALQASSKKGFLDYAVIALSICAFVISLRTLRLQYRPQLVVKSICLEAPMIGHPMKARLDIVNIGAFTAVIFKEPTVRFVFADPVPAPNQSHRFGEGGLNARTYSDGKIEIPHEDKCKDARRIEPAMYRRWIFEHGTWSAENISVLENAHRDNRKLFVLGQLDYKDNVKWFHRLMMVKETPRILHFVRKYDPETKWFVKEEKAGDFEFAT